MLVRSQDDIGSTLARYVNLLKPRTLIIKDLPKRDKDLDPQRERDLPNLFNFGCQISCSTFTLPRKDGQHFHLGDPSKSKRLVRTRPPGA